jgi:hypothetical protein
MNVTEEVVYILYVYSFIILFINVNPSIIHLILFYVYCFISSLWIIRTGCKHFLITANISKILITAQYSLFCTACYYYINKTWNMYKYNHIYTACILLSPLIYTLNIKMVEYLFECSKYNTYNKAYLIYFVVIVINLSVIATMYLNNSLVL